MEMVESVSPFKFWKVKTDMMMLNDRTSELQTSSRDYILSIIFFFFKKKEKLKGPNAISLRRARFVFFAEQKFWDDVEQFGRR